MRLFAPEPRQATVDHWATLYKNKSETDQLVASPVSAAVRAVRLGSVLDFCVGDPQHSSSGQSLFQWPELMTLDYSGHLVLTVGNIPEMMIPRLLSIRNGTLHNHVTNAPQCFVHGAGPGKTFVAHVLKMLQRAQPVKKVCWVAKNPHDL